MRQRDVVSWNAMMGYYVREGFWDEAFELFRQMQAAGLEPNVISWTTMISGHVQNGFGRDAIHLFRDMQVAAVQPNLHTISNIIIACAELVALHQGREMHGFITRHGFQLDEIVGSALVGMYTKCGCLEDARQVFDKMSERDLVSWTAMIAGYAQCGQADEALKLFHQMQLAGLEPDSVTIASVLPGCAHLAALQKGKAIHGYVIRRQFESDAAACSALADMYSKCGCIRNARQTFDKSSQKDLVSWNVMVSAYAMHGKGWDALALFDKMQRTGVKPDEVTFTCLLYACSHAGLVDEGWKYFDLMIYDFDITPTVNHYACMVDLLGRAGCLDEAYKFINKIPVKPNAHVWGALLGACAARSNIELGEHAAERLFELEPQNVAHYVLLSNIYAANGRWDNVANMRKTMKDRGLRKMPGCSWIEVKNKVHKFLAGDKSHPEMDKIYAILKRLTEKIKEAGYVPVGCHWI